MARIEGLLQEIEELNRASASLMKENSALKGLLGRMQQGTEDEAYSIHLQLRSAPDVSVLEMVQHLSLQVPDGRSKSDAERSVDPTIPTTGKDLKSVAIKAWTKVADDELVFDLVVSWFMWDDTQVCPIIDRETLLEAIRTGGTQFCSGFLINVLCAARCVSIHSQLRIESLSNLTQPPVSIRRIQTCSKL